MELPVGWTVILIVAAVWNLIVWPQFFKRVSKDPRARDDAGKPTKFFTVHAVLVGVSLALGIAIGVLGLLTLI
ncbi:MAG: hypothetical protein JJE02_03025 [Propionibacteriales bacterium]|nr:hypothetical protein [Propionibacteriales bacterium]